jgi:hypothetical protein
MSKTKMHMLWCAMISRCTNPNHKNYHNYGGRGVTVCDRWRESFESFYEDMGKAPEGKELERKDNDKGYEPGNCVWATRGEQLRNTRHNHNITYQGKTQCLKDWARELGMTEAALSTRINREKLSVEEAFTRPMRYKR